jgi:hypothetical protein
MTLGSANITEKTYTVKIPLLPKFYHPTYNEGLRSFAKDFVDPGHDYFNGSLLDIYRSYGNERRYYTLLASTFATALNKFELGDLDEDKINELQSKISNKTSKPSDYLLLISLYFKNVTKYKSDTQNIIDMIQTGHTPPIVDINWGPNIARKYGGDCDDNAWNTREFLSHMDLPSYVTPGVLNIDTDRKIRIDLTDGGYILYDQKIGHSIPALMYNEGEIIDISDMLGLMSPHCGITPDVRSIVNDIVPVATVEVTMNEDLVRYILTEPDIDNVKWVLGNIRDDLIHIIQISHGDIKKEVENLESDKTLREKKTRNEVGKIYIKGISLNEAYKIKGIESFAKTVTVPTYSSKKSPYPVPGTRFSTFLTFNGEEFILQTIKADDNLDDKYTFNESNFQGEYSPAKDLMDVQRQMSWSAAKDLLFYIHNINGLAIPLFTALGGILLSNLLGGD